MMTTKLCHRVCIASILTSSCVLANIYQLPIKQHSNRETHRPTIAQHQQLQHVLEPNKPNFIQTFSMPELSFETQRRSDDAQKATDYGVNSGGIEDSEELRELHQAVDTVAKLLNEEEKNQKERQQHEFGDQILDSSGTSLNVLKTQPELMSESAIREAIKQLERVQQQERREALEAESNLMPVMAHHPSGNSVNIAPAPLQPQALKAKQATLSGLIEELGDELTDEQMVAASQEAERILGRGNMSRMTGQNVENANKQKNEKEQEQEKAVAQESQYKSSTPISLQKQPQQEATESTSINSDEKSLLVGQLDSLSSELGPALTEDFYTFHADSNGSENKEQMLSVTPSNQYQDSSATSTQNQRQAQSNNDLESAAQTRNSVTQQDPSQAPNPFRHDSNTIRFDFNQPAPGNPQPSSSKQPRQLQPLSNDQEEVIKAFRQQTGSNIGNDQFATTTLIPNSSQDNFWRPSGGVNTEDISQQYNRASTSTQQSFPPLPPSRFQNSNLSGQFSQPVASSRQAQHIHYTGHSLIPSTQSQPQFPAPQQEVVNNKNRVFVPTTPPLISVLSNSDTSGGNSVLWNPPATLNPPPSQPQPPFNQRPQSFMQPPNPPNTNVDVIKPQFFSPPNRGPASPLFPSAFQGVTEGNTVRKPIDSRDRDFRSPSNQNNPVTETNSNVEVTTEERFTQATTATQWSPPAVSGQPVERDISDSQPRSSFRSSQNSTPRFFSPNELIGPSSTLSPINTEPPKTPKADSPPTVVTTTPSSSTPNSTAKKEDMVIYYYYYYDDNKNATVVAKNVTSSPSAASSSNLEAAIEADSGLEDTPYMDDPAPIVNPRPSSIKPTLSTTTTTTTASPPPISSTFPSSIHDNWLRGSVVSSRAPTGNDFMSGAGRQTTFDREPSSNQFNDFVKPTFAEQPRGHIVMPSRAPLPASRERQSDQPFTSTPFSVPYTSTFNPASRQSANRDPLTSNRIISTEPSISHGSSTHSTPNRVDSGSHRHQQPIHHSHQASSANNKPQTDLIHNVPNGMSNSPPRQTSSFATAPTPVSSSTSNSNSIGSTGSSGRGPLSNASRYGTNNNLVLDPYGLDPAAPATLVHSSHIPDNSANHHKNWQPTASQGAGHHFNRKPAAVTESSSVSSTSSTENISSARSQGSSATRMANQHFASQRNSNIATVIAPIPSRLPSQPLPGTRVSGPLNKQFFPESNNQASNSIVDQNRNEQVVRVSQKQSLQEQSSLPTRTQPSRQTPSISSNDFSGNRLIPEEITPKLQATNGRPSTPDGNTSNGFTRSPIPTTPISTPAPIPSTSLKSQSSSMSDSMSSSLSSTTQPSISTSVSRSFVTAQQVQVTTSVSQPTVTSTTTATATSTSQSSSVAPTMTTQQNTTSQTFTPNQSSVSNPVTTTPTTTQESSRPTESADSANTSTRKKFGNRTNRFQTRINSLSASRSTSTTTSTTPSPSVSSTTRRTTTSTTRKSNKQLFPGRRRLSSNQQQSTDTANNISSVASSSSSSSSSALDSSSVSSSPGRPKFGNSFTARSRSSTPSSTQAQELSGTTQKPSSLFGAQRATSKPRLPFLKSTKPAATIVNGEGSQSLNELPSDNVNNPVPTDTALTSSDKPIIEKSTLNETGSDDSGEETSAGSSEDESAQVKKDLASMAPNNNTSMVLEATTTAASSPPTAPEAPSSRNKPKLRPLFASRQRSSSLFGNRRSNSNSTTTS